MSSLVNFVRSRARQDPASNHIALTHSPVQIEMALHLLMIADMAAGFIGAIFVLNLQELDFYAITVGDALPYVLMPLCGSIGVLIFGGYRKYYSASIVRPLLHAAAGAFVGLISLAGLISLSSSELAPFTGGMVLIWGLICGLHLVFLIAVTRLFNTKRFMQKIVLIGATPHAERLIAANETGSNYQILGVFDDRADRRPDDALENTDGQSLSNLTISSQPLLGKIDDLLKWEHLPQVDQIVITVTSNASERIKMLIERLRILPQQVILLMDIDSFTSEESNVINLAETPAAYVSGRPVDLRQRLVKRLTDILLSLLMIVVFSPVMLVCAVLIKLEDGGPILFHQQRHGFRNELIRIWKLRSMSHDPDAEKKALRQTAANDLRVTRIGKFIRSTSLDELPQLFNVLSGKMSLVGPRPHAVGMTTEAAQMHEIVAEYSHRHRVKPGITGWAQINGSRGPVHSQDEVRDRVRLDIEYLNTASFLFDLYILLMTAPALLGDHQKDR